MKICILDIRINNQSIERVIEFNFLGLIIDEHLKWNAHIQKISNKIATSIWIMDRLMRYLPLSILRTLYNALVSPHSQFCILDWRFKANKIIRLQKRAIRVITNSNYKAHVKPLYEKLNLLKIDIFRNSLVKLHYIMDPEIFLITLCTCSLHSLMYIVITPGDQVTPIYWKKWTRIATLDSLYFSEKSVYNVVSLNATSQIVTLVVTFLQTTHKGHS